MTSCNWKTNQDYSAANIKYIPFPKCRKFFAVDDSGSTSGAVLTRERDFVDHLRGEQFANRHDAISLWGWECDVPTKQFDAIQWRSNHGATRPSEILKQTKALSRIKKADVWFLMTDGEIYDSSVPLLAGLAHDGDILSVPVVFLIVGSRGRTPGTTNISVGVSFFAGSQDALILFKETATGKIYVMAAKGCFASLGRSAAAHNHPRWVDIPVFQNEDVFFNHCQDLDVKVPKVRSRANVPRSINLGPEWDRMNQGSCWVNIELLLQAGSLEDNDLFNLLAGEAFHNLAIAYKTRKRTQEFRSFLQAQKVGNMAPKFKDVSGAAAIIVKLGKSTPTAAERSAYQQELRSAHKRNQEHYQEMLAEFADTTKGKALKKRNKQVDAALRTLGSIEAEGFTVNALRRIGNRSRLAETVSSENSVDIASIDLQGDAWRDYCLICCGTNEVMSICLKELKKKFVKVNTTDVALRYPLGVGAQEFNADIISSQIVCFQCALLVPDDMSIYKEKIKAIIPAVKYDGMNKEYINDQLYLALTGGVKTGPSEIGQLFMSILDEVFRTKIWAAAGRDHSQVMREEDETARRVRTFVWMLDEFLENVWTRETFTESGKWVRFPQALDWVGKDFQANGLASFVVTYPASGWAKFCSLGEKADVYPEGTTHAMFFAKYIHHTVQKYLEVMEIATRKEDHTDQWKQKFLETIYQQFNATSMAAIFGEDSAVATIDVDEDSPVLMRKIQVILFWLIHQQDLHCTQKTFYNNIAQKEPLASVVLGSSLICPEPEAQDVLLSIFAKRDAPPTDPDAAALHLGPVPFKNPFGASVLRCGIEACGEPFCDFNIEQLDERVVEIIRQARTQHLIKAFGIRGHFEDSGNGMPEPSAAGKPPTSIHTNLHIGIVRTWAEHTREERRVIIDGEDEREAFVGEVLEEICAQGRGDVFKKDIGQDIRAALPSFFEVLAQALRLDGKDDEDIAVYEHDFEQNKVKAKIEWELKARNQ